MRIEILFLCGCFAMGLSLICWKLMISPAIRDRKVRALARNARRTTEPKKVIINFIPIPAKFGFMADVWNYDIQSNEEHWYFSVCAFLTPTVVTKLQDGDRGLMYMEKSEDFVACCIETEAGALLGTLSVELPAEQGIAPADRGPKDDSWKRKRIL